MSIESRIVTAVTPIIPEVAAGQYEGDALEYITFNRNGWGMLYADSEPRAVYSLVQVHYYCPHKQNPRETLEQLAEAIFSAGFAFPSVTDASDEDGQHYVLETSDAEGRENGTVHH